jgi:hypothetical protein
VLEGRIKGQRCSPHYTLLDGRNTARRLWIAGSDSHNQCQLGGEMAIHYPGLKGLDKPAVMVFQTLLVCLDCGFTEFTFPENELRILDQGMPGALRVGFECDS